MKRHYDIMPVDYVYDDYMIYFWHVKKYKNYKKRKTSL